MPTEFFECHLGPLHKYSSCEWAHASNLKDAEIQTFQSYIDKMNLNQLEEEHMVGRMPHPADGEAFGHNRIRILEIGCGWGSFLLYASAKFPSMDFVGFSNSSTQIAYIQREAHQRGLNNLKALKLDINDFCNNSMRSRIPEFTADKKFDRIISIECLEHRLVILQFFTSSRLYHSNSYDVFSK